MMSPSPGEHDPLNHIDDAGDRAERGSDALGRGLQQGPSSL